MGSGVKRLRRRDLPTVPVTLQTAGVDGAGGAGFPTYAKWDRLSDVRWLLVNHQESEPNYFIDKYVGRARARAFAEFFEAMLERRVFEAIVVCAKEKDRSWLRDLERETGATVVDPADLPILEADRRGVIVAYTDDRYEYGMESVLLRLVGDVTMGTGLPMDFGWLVQNTESIDNVIRALDDGTPVIEKHVHVDGDVPNHRFLLAPVGTTATTLLAAAGVDTDDLDDSAMLADGGPGWCFAIAERPEEWGLRKRTNCLLVLDRELAETNTLGDERINVLKSYLERGDRTYEQAPTRVDPDHVKVPLISNPSLAGIVQPAIPVVEVGEPVAAGQRIAKPADEGFSTVVHASIDGVVAAVSESHVEIRRLASEREPVSDGESASEGDSSTGHEPASVPEGSAELDSESTETGVRDSTDEGAEPIPTRDRTDRDAAEADAPRSDGDVRQPGIKSRLNRIDSASPDHRFLPAVYWTWCTDCGSYATYPDIQTADDPAAYRCSDCDEIRGRRSTSPPAGNASSMGGSTPADENRRNSSAAGTSAP